MPAVQPVQPHLAAIALLATFLGAIVTSNRGFQWKMRLLFQAITMKSEKYDLATENFFYYCMGLRKGLIRQQVSIMQSQYPNDTPERLAKRFIAAQIPLSMVSSALVHIPTVIPVAGPAFRFLGLASGTTLMMVLNMTLAMQIALIFGYDLDDRARIKELLAVIAATGLASGSTSLIPQLSSLRPRLRAVAGGATIMTTSQLIGEIARKHYSRKRIAASAHASREDNGRVTEMSSG